MSSPGVSAPDPIRELLAGVRTIAVVGWSPDRSRPSARIAGYLQRAGYRVIPVNPTVAAVDGIRSFARLDEIPEPIDLVVVFRRSEDADRHVDEAIARGVRGIWLQEGVTTVDGAARARAAGIAYVEDRCVMVEHRARF